VADCSDAERSSGAEEAAAAVVASISPNQTAWSSQKPLFDYAAYNSWFTAVCPSSWFGSACVDGGVWNAMRHGGKKKSWVRSKVVICCAWAHILHPFYSTAGSPELGCQAGFCYLIGRIKTTPRHDDADNHVRAFHKKLYYSVTSVDSLLR
jgi:hypothetical protein